MNDEEIEKNDLDCMTPLEAAVPYTTIRYRRVVDIPQESPFPCNIVYVRQYNSWRVIALIVFLIALYGFAHAIFDPIVSPGKYTESIAIQIDNRGILKKMWDWSYELLWQKVPEGKRIEIGAEKKVFWMRMSAFIAALAAWLFVWMCFDWRNAQRFVYGGFLVLFGIGYILLPIEAIPDAIPVLGLIDDLLVAAFGVGLGLTSIINDLRQKKESQHLREIIKDHPSTGLRLLLKEHGLTVEEVDEDKNA
jgi:hypothetical protein